MIGGHLKEQSYRLSTAVSVHILERLLSNLLVCSLEVARCATRTHLLCTTDNSSSPMSNTVYSNLINMGPRWLLLTRTTGQNVHEPSRLSDIMMNIMQPHSAALAFQPDRTAGIQVPLCPYCLPIDLLTAGLSSMNSAAELQFRHEVNV